MSNFEIRIFANPAGYLPEGLNLNYTPELFTQDLVNKRNFDGERGTFKEGTYSVLYAPEAYIIDYQFNVVNEAGFRAPEAHISLAIRRGYKLIDVNSVFVNLRKEFNIFAAEEKASVVQSIHKKLSDFNNIIGKNIIEDLDQPRINAGTSDYLNRGLVPYDNEEQRDALLENPNRSKFRGYGIIYILPLAEARNIYNSGSIYKGISMSPDDYAVNRQFDLVFPDGHKEIISSRSAEVNYTCSKPYHKPLEFHGSPLEHWKEWMISTDKEGITLTIGKQPEPETKEIRVICYDTKHRVINAPASLRFDFGKFNAQTGVLLLTGNEIGTQNNIRYDTKIIKVTQTGNTNDTIEFTITRLYVYNVSKAFDFISGESIPEIKIYRKGQNSVIKSLKKNDPIFSSDMGPDGFEYEIPATTKYLAARAGFSPLCEPQKPKFTKKDVIDIVFTINNKEIHRRLEKESVDCLYRTSHDRSQEGYPQKQAFNEDGKLTIKDVPPGSFSYKIEIKGYKPQAERIELYNGEKQRPISLRFEKTGWRKTVSFLNNQKWNVAILIIGLAIGGFARPYIIKENGNSQSPEKGTNISALTVERDSFANENKKLQLENAELKNRLNQILLLTTNGDSTNGGSTNGGSTNGGSTNGGWGIN